MKKDMDLVITLVIFISVMITTVVTGYSLVIAMSVGYMCFLLLGLHRKFELRFLLKCSREGLKNGVLVAGIILLIGLVTGTWRSSGIIALFVHYGIELISPHIFILLIFVMCCIASYAMGTSFGVVGSIGVILMTLARAGDVSLMWTAGAIISGAFFGDRFSPVSSSMMLTAAVTETDRRTNLNLMAKTMVLPTAIALVLYVFISYMNPIASVDLSVNRLIDETFTLSWVLIIPVIIMIFLPIFRVDVKIAAVASAGIAWIESIYCQNMSVMEATKSALFGFETEGRAGEIFNGGGLVSMIEICIIICLSCMFAGIIEKTKILDDALWFMTIGCQKIGRATMTFLSGVAFSALFCNQTIASVMNAVTLRKAYEDTGGDKQELAIDIENSTIILAPWIPWSIGAMVPLGMLDITFGAVLHSVYVIIFPFVWLAEKKYIWPRIDPKRKGK